MVAQRRERVRKPRDKREGREERQNPEEGSPQELQEAILLRREDFIVSCAQQTREALFNNRHCSEQQLRNYVAYVMTWSEQSGTTLHLIVNFYNNSPPVLSKSSIRTPNKYNTSVLFE
jgi:hypothetical protein